MTFISKTNTVRELKGMGHVMNIFIVRVGLYLLHQYFLYKRKRVSNFRADILKRKINRAFLLSSLKTPTSSKYCYRSCEQNFYQLFFSAIGWFLSLPLCYWFTFSSVRKRNVDEIINSKFLLAPLKLFIHFLKILSLTLFRDPTAANWSL
jgi:hypothetical protein